MLLPFLILWLAIGALMGWIASKFINLRGDEPMGGIAVTAVAAALSGVAGNLYSGHGLTEWNLGSCLYAAIGGGIALTIWHIVRARFVSRESYTTRKSY